MIKPEQRHSTIIIIVSLLPTTAHRLEVGAAPSSVGTIETDNSKNGDGVLYPDSDDTDGDAYGTLDGYYFSANGSLPKSFTVSGVERVTMNAAVENANPPMMSITFDNNDKTSSHPNRVTTGQLIVNPDDSINHQCFTFDTFSMISKPKAFLKALADVAANEEGSSNNKALTLKDVKMCLHPRYGHPSTIMFGKDITVELSRSGGRRTASIPQIIGYYQGVSEHGLQIQMIVEKKVDDDDAGLLQCKLRMGKDKDGIIEHTKPLVMVKEESMTMIKGQQHRPCYSISLNMAVDVVSLMGLGIVADQFFLCFRQSYALFKCGVPSDDDYFKVVLSRWKSVEDRCHPHDDNHQLYIAHIQRQYLKYVAGLEVDIADLDSDEVRVVIRFAKGNDNYIESEEVSLYQKSASRFARDGRPANLPLQKVITELNSGRVRWRAAIVISTMPTMSISLGSARFPLFKSIVYTSSKGRSTNKRALPPSCSPSSQPETKRPKVVTSGVLLPVASAGRGQHLGAQEYTRRVSTSRDVSGDDTFNVMAIGCIAHGIYVNEKWTTGGQLHDRIVIEVVCQEGSVLGVTFQLEEATDNIPASLATLSGGDGGGSSDHSLGKNWSKKKTCFVPLSPYINEGLLNHFYLKTAALPDDDRRYLHSTLARIAVMRGIRVDGPLLIEAYVRGTAPQRSPMHALRLTFGNSKPDMSIILRLAKDPDDPQKYPRLTPGDAGAPGYICYAAESPSQGFNSIRMRVYGSEQQQQQSPAAASVEFFFEFSLPLILKPPCRVPLKKADDSDELFLDTTELNETEAEEVSVQFVQAGLYAGLLRPIFLKEVRLLRLDDDNEWTLRLGRDCTFTLKPCTPNQL